MTDDPTEVPEEEAPQGQTAPPEGNVDEAPDDGLEEVDDEDTEVPDEPAEGET